MFEGSRSGLSGGGPTKRCAGSTLQHLAWSTTAISGNNKSATLGTSLGTIRVTNYHGDSDHLSARELAGAPFPFPDSGPIYTGDLTAHGCTCKASGSAPAEWSCRVLHVTRHRCPVPFRKIPDSMVSRTGAPSAAVSFHLALGQDMTEHPAVPWDQGYITSSM